MHIRVCDLDGDGSSITVNFFIENVIAEIFEKERDGIGGLLVNRAGRKMRIGQILIGNKGLDCRLVQLLNQGELVLNRL